MFSRAPCSASGKSSLGYVQPQSDMFGLGRVCSASVRYVQPRLCPATHHAQPRVSPASGMFSLGR
eukprot:1199444-Pyramimonas_sp.AAC.1